MTGSPPSLEQTLYRLLQLAEAGGIGGGGGAPLSDVDPANLEPGEPAAPGVAALASRGDHVHALVNVAEADDLAALGVRVTAAEGDIDDLETDVGQLQTDLNAAEAAIVVLDGRVDTNDAAIAVLDGRVDTAEGEIDVLQAEVAALEGVAARYVGWMTPVPFGKDPDGLGAVNIQATTVMEVQLYHFPTAISIDRLLWGGNATAAGNVQVGIYSDQGVKLFEDGPYNTGTLVQDIDPPWEIPPGNYYVATVATTNPGSAQLFKYNTALGSISTYSSNWQSTYGGPPGGNVTVSAGVLPASFAPFTDINRALFTVVGALIHFHGS